MIGFDLDFEPDAFQLEAAEAIRSGASVVVTAPTGSGKTLVAEVAIREALSRGKKAFYTTPLKALSNQKFNDMREQFPDVGLLTGDNTINGDAPLVVMTTEVIRNMIYAGSTALAGLEVVILDEVHYLQDRFRGQVWEEIIVHAPAATQLVCLSATVSNADEFTAWVRSRRGRTTLIQAERRPVPLVNLYAVNDRWNDEVLMDTMLKKHRPNQSIESRISGKGARRYGTPRRIETVSALAAKGMLPVIYFIFSRAGCNDAAARLVSSGAKFTDATARETIRRVAEERTAHLDPGDLTVLEYEGWLTGLQAGIAPHHAGMVPAFKETVEDLFARGLIKVVFATETLSLGINMPARTVVLESLSRFTGEAHELLRAGDYTQLTGRAGRRGIDEVGYGVVLHSRFVPFAQVAKLAAAGSHTLQSSFRPTYNMAVNLVANYSRERAQKLLNASFGQFQASRGIRKKARSLERREAELASLRNAASCDRGDVAEYRDLLNASTTRESSAMGGLHRGRVIEVVSGSKAGRYIVMKRSRGKRVELVVISTRGKVVRLRPNDVGPDAVSLGSMVMTDSQRMGDPKFRADIARQLRAFQGRPDPLRNQHAELEHPVATCPDKDAHLRALERAHRLQRQNRQLGKDLELARGGLVRELEQILDLLEDRGYVDGWKLTPRGERLRVIYSELDLLISEAVHIGLFDGLSPAEMAALVSMTVYEPRKAAGGTEAWPSEALRERALQLEAVWEELVADERARGLPQTRRPDPGFVSLAYRWTMGEDLSEVLGTQEAGDFVRTSRQLLDVMRQVREAAQHLADPLGAAIRGIDRGVVAAVQ
ncbi:MAG: DEAD/DEAH box helicase [Gammaproteobacteria bacterium]|nr:DEAD/DEAH box helicase [Gammaproteobacteria bacterium]